MNTKSESTKKLSGLLKAVFTIIIIGAIGSVVYLGSMMTAVAGVFSSRVEPMPFDSSVWRANIPIESHDSVRLRMADDLVANYLEVGMHESLMHAILGYPDPYKPLPGYDIMYYLGALPPGSDHSSVWLAIKLNDRGEIDFFKVAAE